MRWWIISLVGVVGLAAVIGGAVAWSRQGESGPRTVPVRRQTVTQEVVFTGNLEARQAAALGFEQAGVMAELLVKEGERVAAGQTLAELDTELAALELAAARAERASAQAEARVAWENAQAAESRVQAENVRLLEEKRQAVRNEKRKLDQEREVRQQKTREGGDDTAAAASAYAAVVAQEAAYAAAQEALATLEKTVAKSNEQARAAVETAEATYLGTTQAAAGSAGLAALEAREALAGARVQRSVLTAPWAGTVVRTSVEAHEFVPAGSTVVTLEGDGGWEIVAAVPETDALKIRPGQPGRVTFDALPPDQEWEATVTEVATSAVVIEGLPTYEVRLQLAGDVQALRSGLTANVTVRADSRTGVLAVPRRTVVRQDGRQFVRVVTRDGWEEREVETGLIGSDGTIEIRRGVQEGEAIVVALEGS